MDLDLPVIFTTPVVTVVYPPPPLCLGSEVFSTFQQPQGRVPGAVPRFLVSRAHKWITTGNLLPFLFAF